MTDENRYGEQLKQRRELLGLSIKKLAKITGVSRRWIQAAEQNHNISIDVLKKLAGALKLTQIDLSEMLTVSVAPVPPDTALLAAAVEDIYRSTLLAQQAVEKIKTFSLGVGKSARNDTPPSEGFSDRAASLVRQFTEHVRTLSETPAKLQKVEKAVSRLLEPDAETAADDARPRQRNTTTA